VQIFIIAATRNIHFHIKSILSKSVSCFFSLNMSFQHRKYESIPLATKVPNEDDDGRYAYLEKIHGINWSVYAQKNGTVQFASRNQFADPECPGGYYGFFEHGELKIKLETAVRKLLIDLDASNVIVYGELFGGHYPGKVTPTGLKQVQKGVCYSPNLEFRAFDVVADGRYLEFDHASDVCLDVGLLFPPMMIVQGRADCIKIVEDLLKLNTGSTVAFDLGLPELPNNCVEGFVIRKIGDSGNRDEMFKMIHPKFRETVKSAGRKKSGQDLWEKQTTAVTAHATRVRFDKVRGNFPTAKEKELVTRFIVDCVEDLGAEVIAELFLPEKLKKALGKKVHDFLSE